IRRLPKKKTPRLGPYPSYEGGNRQHNRDDRADGQLEYRSPEMPNSRPTARREALEQLTSGPQVPEQRTGKDPEAHAQQGPHERHRQPYTHEPTDDTTGECQDCTPCGTTGAP